MLKGFTYNRFNSTMQREESIEVQIKFNHDYTKRNNIEIVKDYMDEAILGKTDNRPAFLQMLKDVKLGLFDVVICILKLEAQTVTSEQIDKKLQEQRIDALNKNLIVINRFIAFYINSVIINKNI